MVFYPHHSPFLLAGILLSTLLFITWKRRNLISGRAFLLMIALVLLWNVTFLLELIVTDPAMKILMVQFQFIAIAFMPMAWFAFTAMYTGFASTPFHWLFLSVIPVLTNVLVWLVPRPNWFWGNPTVVAGALFPILDYNYQFWFYYIHAPMTYVIFLLTLGLLIRAYYKKPAIYRFQIITLIGALLLPLIFDLIYVTGYSPVPGVNYSSATFSFSAVIIAWALYRYKFLDLVPMAREIIFEKMDEGILITDLSNRIVDINPAAMRMLALTRDSIGQALQIQADRPALKCILNMTENRLKTSSFHLDQRTASEEPRYFECSAVYIEDAEGDHLASVISIRENTEQMALFKIVHEQSIQDELTGIFNRRYFFQKGKTILQRSLWQSEEPLALIAVDIDNLKPINDRYGHQTGDTVLKNFCEITRQELRPLDLFCRMGGDEFAIILPGTSTEEALQVANRILKAVSCVPTNDNPQEPVHISVSIGIAATDDLQDNTARTIEELLHAADTYMYEAKRSGGNRIVRDLQTAAGGTSSQS